MEYHRNLPHFQPEGASLFVTFRLFGTMPAAARSPETARDLAARHNRALLPKSLTPQHVRPARCDGAAFAVADRELERMLFGPDWLSRPQLAECVTETIRDGERVRALYGLVAFVVMPNHVHMLIEPDASMPKITQYVKGVSARQANRLLGRTGQAFWQDESFDRWVRSRTERRNIVRYIEFNPVRAGLAVEPGAFRYSSAFSG